MIIDIGTGDGRAVLAGAGRDPSALFIGIDAAAASMAESSRRADRRGPRNVVSFAAGAEGPLDKAALDTMVDRWSVTLVLKEEGGMRMEMNMPPMDAISTIGSLVGTWGSALLLIPDDQPAKRKIIEDFAPLVAPYDPDAISFVGRMD